MTAFTTHYNIEYPTASDSIAPLNEAFSTMATDIDTVLNTNLGPIAGKVQTYLYRVTNTTALNALTGMVVGSLAFVETGADGTWEQHIYLGSGDGWKVTNKPWTTYTHTNPTNFTVNISRYRISDGIVTVQFKATKTAGAAGETSSATSTTITLPTNAPASASIDSLSTVGYGTYKAGSTGYPVGIVGNATTTNVKAMVFAGTTGAYRALTQRTSSTNVPPISINDIIYAEFSYEKA